ncbi:MAG: universal stress protein [Chitinophagaceae bacterium]|nr:universal stress protein [Chitinophagaceae bacterium]
MHTIIIPTDFSPVAINAMNYAVDLAKAINASVTLLHTYEIPVSYTGTDVPLPIINIEDLEAMNREKLEHAKEQVERITGNTLTVYTELRMGGLVPELEDVAEKLKPFAVVMGTKGAGFVERLFIGSSTLSTLRHLTWPVVVVPPGCIFKGIKKIGFACDFKAVEQSIPAAVIKQWVKAFDAELEILNVDYNNKNFKPDTPEQSVLLHAMLQDAKPKYFFINKENVEAGISEFAESNNIDLIVVVPKKQRLLDVLFQRSHTTELAIHSHIPILSIHEND